MGQPSKRTPELTKKLLDLHARGASNREIADALDLSPPTIGRWLGEVGLEANGGLGPRRGRYKKQIEPETEQVLQAAAMAEAELEGGEVDSFEGAMARLSFLRRAITSNQAAFLKGEFPAGHYKALCEIELKYLAKVEGFRQQRAAESTAGKPPVDVAAAEAFDQKLRALVARAEMGTRCAHCGKHPFERHERHERGGR